MQQILEFLKSVSGSFKRSILSMLLLFALVFSYDFIFSDQKMLKLFSGKINSRFSDKTGHRKMEIDSAWLYTKDIPVEVCFEIIREVAFEYSKNPKKARDGDLWNFSSSEIFYSVRCAYDENDNFGHYIFVAGSSQSKQVRKSVEKIQSSLKLLLKKSIDEIRIDQLKSTYRNLLPRSTIFYLDVPKSEENTEVISTSLEKIGFIRTDWGFRMSDVVREAGPSYETSTSTTFLNRTEPAILLVFGDQFYQAILVDYSRKLDVKTLQNRMSRLFKKSE